MSATTSYNPNSFILKRFVSLAWEGVKPEATIAHDKNIVEKMGDGLLYIPENLPRVIKNVCTNPQVLTIAAFAAAHLANSYGFYPTQTKEVVRVIRAYLPEITEGMIRFGGWFSTSSLITGICARIGGRLTEGYCARLAATRT
jgi:uncharacterized membrane protein YhdT